MATPIDPDGSRDTALGTRAALATQIIRPASGESSPDLFWASLGEEQLTQAAPATNTTNELSGAQRWDYVAHPVTVDGRRLAELSEPPDFSAAAQAFDGYGAQGATPAAVRAWQVNLRPTPSQPESLVIDYGTPIAVSAFVHYCYVPNSRDLRWLSPAPSAFQTVRISARAREEEEWRVVTTLGPLTATCPQVLAIPATDPARYWRLEILGLVPGAEMIASYEIETYTGGIPQLKLPASQIPPQPAAFAERMRTHRPATGIVTGNVVQSRPTHQTLSVSLTHQKRSGTGELQLLMDGTALALQPKGQRRWEAALPEGMITVRCQFTAMGLLLELAFTAHADQPVKYRRATVQLSIPDGRLYYIPAYMWQSSPSDISVPTVKIQTRLAAIGVTGLTLCLVPGTDRGNLGFGGHDPQ